MARGWLLLLCGYLALWQPLTFAAEATGAMETLTMRGPVAVVELMAHAAITAFAVAAAWALWNGNPNAPAIAEAAVACCTLEVLQSLSWSRLPHDVAPGDRWPIALAAITHATGWIVYLRKSRRVRSLYWN
jgi:Protein of unknown function (DUF2569)